MSLRPRDPVPFTLYKAVQISLALHAKGSARGGQRSGSGCVSCCQAEPLPGAGKTKELAVMNCHEHPGNRQTSTAFRNLQLQTNGCDSADFICCTGRSVLSQDAADTLCMCVWKVGGRRMMPEVSSLMGSVSHPTQNNLSSSFTEQKNTFVPDLTTETSPN